MGPIVLAIYFTFGALILIYIFGGKSRGRNYPRGPWALPVFGNLLFLGNSPHKKLTEWSKEYGTIMAIEFGSFPTVVISDGKLIKAALNEQDFQGRPNVQTCKDRSFGVTKGVIFTEGKEWEEQRKFIIQTLNDFNIRKKSMEIIIQEEIKELIDEFKKIVRKPIVTQIRFNAAVLNILWTFITGERFKYDDPELQVAIKYLNSSVEKQNKKGSLSVFIPILLKIAPKFCGYEKLLESIFPILEFLKKPIEYHKNTIQEGQPRDFIDIYLDEINKTTDTGSSFYKGKGEKSLLFCIYDLFAAGSETTSTALGWTFLYMAKYSKVQKKLQEEIDKIVGHNRLPCLADRPNMPYTEAVIHEVLRFSSLSPFGITHNTTKDVVFEKFTIPKNTMIVANIYGSHMDEEYWGDPDNFRPGRFINKHGEFKHKENFLAFSFGKRICLGENFARDVLFLFITSLFQIFNVKPSTSWDELSIEQELGGETLAPLPHKLILTQRVI